MNDFRFTNFKSLFIFLKHGSKLNSDIQNKTERVTYKLKYQPFLKDSTYAIKHFFPLINYGLKW